MDTSANTSPEISELFEVCACCDQWKLYHRAEDGCCSAGPIFRRDGVTKRRVWGNGYFTSISREI
jgi:hypothetical protein